ncbi:hypothetical protein KC357_g147 [Hortaea werneckii]|nr:hypothetical protein KC357_g147 [Hortaea werneckii]
MRDSRVIYLQERNVSLVSAATNIKSTASCRAPGCGWLRRPEQACESVQKLPVYAASIVTLMPLRSIGIRPTQHTLTSMRLAVQQSACFAGQSLAESDGLCQGVVVVGGGRRGSSFVFHRARSASRDDGGPKVREWAGVWRFPPTQWWCDGRQVQFVAVIRGAEQVAVSCPHAELEWKVVSVADVRRAVRLAVGGGGYVTLHGTDARLNDGQRTASGVSSGLRIRWVGSSLQLFLSCRGNGGIEKLNDEARMRRCEYATQACPAALMYARAAARTSAKLRAGTLLYLGARFIVLQRLPSLVTLLPVPWQRRGYESRVCALCMNVFNLGHGHAAAKEESPELRQLAWGVGWLWLVAAASTTTTTTTPTTTTTTTTTSQTVISSHISFQPSIIHHETRAAARSAVS